MEDFSDSSQEDNTIEVEENEKDCSKGGKKRKSLEYLEDDDRDTYVECIFGSAISLDLLPPRALEKILDFSNVKTRKTLAEISPGMNMIHNAKVLDSQMSSLSVSGKSSDNIKHQSCNDLLMKESRNNRRDDEGMT